MIADPMLSEPGNEAQPVAVLFSGGLDSAVLLGMAAAQGPAVPIYVAVGLAWEAAEIRAAERLLRAAPFAGRVRPLVRLHAEMRDVYPANHWAIRGEAPGYDTPDSDVYLDGRNVILLSKAAVYMARAGIERVFIGPLAGNPFPDATPQFFAAMSAALSLGLAAPIRIEAPLAHLHKADVVGLGRQLGVPLDLTLSCMQPDGDGPCGRCSKCRERDAGGA
jgi:7-cyano-7-deazaguanine synthase